MIKFDPTWHISSMNSLDFIPLGSDTRFCNTSEFAQESWASEYN